MSEDYLKYWRVIRYFIKAKYKLTTADLDMLLFLKSEPKFSKDKFDEFNELLSWDKNRFEKLKQEGWIEVFRLGNKAGQRRALYQLSYKAQRMLTSLYKKLSGEEIPTSQSSNPIFAKNVSYTDKVYRNFILDLNAYIRDKKYS
jgi:hypothetical protein